VGGVLAFAATFLPLVYLTYPATHGRINASPQIPAQVFIGVTRFPQGYAHAQASSIIGAGIWAFLLWGTPIILAILGLTLLLARRWTPGLGIWIVALILVLLGVGWTLVSCLFVVNLAGAVVQVFTYGAGMSLLGYLAALVAAIWLAFQRGGRTR